MPNNIVNLELKTPGELLDEIMRLRAAHERILAVCIDNAGSECSHKLALKFVGKIANKSLSDFTRVCEQTGLSKELDMRKGEG